MIPFRKLGLAHGLDSRLAENDWDAYASGLSEILTAHTTGPYQAANNRLNAVQPATIGRRLHRTSMMAVRGYGETALAFLAYQRATFEMDPSVWAAYKAEAQQWDRVTCEALRECLSEVASEGLWALVFPGGLSDAFQRVADEGGSPARHPVLGIILPVFADLAIS